MRCQYCGKENSEASIFCEGCGAKLGANDAQNMNQGYGSPNNNYNQQPKKNTGLIVSIIILSVLLIAGIIVGVILLTSGGSKNDNGNSSKGNNYSDNGKNYYSDWDDDDDYDWDDDDDYDWDDDDDDDDDYNYGYKKNTNDYDRDVTGTSNYLTCKMTEADGQKIDVTFVFDSAQTKLKSYDMTMSIPLDATYKQLGDDYLESLFESTVCSTGDYDSCEISVEDDQVIIYIEAYTQTNLATYNGYPKSQLKTYMTNQGYTCN